jgi:hypothetical protein
MLIYTLIDRGYVLPLDLNYNISDCLGVWLQMFLKVFFMPKCIKMSFFIF